MERGIPEVGSDEVARMIENGEVSEENIFFNVKEDIPIPPNMTADDIPAVLSDAKFLSDRIMKLKQAHLRFSCLSKVSHNTGLDFERYYRELYDDIQEHYDYWFERLFNVDNPKATHAEFTTGILGTLCTILRQRGDLKGCAEVMPTYMAVLKRYQQMTKGCGRDPQIQCCRGLTYRADIIRINLGVQTSDKKMAIEAFHSAVDFEKKEKALKRYDVDTAPDMDGIMEHFFGHNRFDEVDDDDIFNALVFMNDDPDVGSPKLELRKCGCCDKGESMRGDFKKCSRCHDQPYCSKKCQTDDWKVHRHLCGDRNNTNIDSNSLLWITQQLVKNHTATVELRSEHRLTKSQKDGAKAALVKQLKVMFTGDFKKFNSRASCSDAASDPAFCASLAEFFAKLPGYEKVWGELCIGYKEELERQNQMRRQRKALTVPDDVIREYCTEMARTLTMQIGFMLADGNTSEMVNLERHRRLIDELVLFVKRFVGEHLEYDSYAGIRGLGQNDEFKAEMVDVIGRVMDIEIG